MIISDSIVKGSTGKLCYNDSILTPADMTAVGYVISTTLHPVKEEGCHTYMVTYEHY